MKIMIVQVKVDLTQTPTSEDVGQMYTAVASLTNDPTSIAILQVSADPPVLLAEFTVPTAPEYKVVDKISRAFWRMPHYSTSTIWFPKQRSRPAAPAASPPYTPKQGQYLAFIYYYTKLHGRPPAQADIQRYFGVTPPTVHQMILKLEELGLLERAPGQARSLRVRLPHEALPDLK